MKTLTLIALSLFVAGIAAAADYSWTGNGANVNWSTPGNWTNGTLGSYPQTSSDTATWTNLPGTRQPTLDVNVSLLSMTIASNLAWTFSGVATATVQNALIFSNTAATTFAPCLAGTCTVIVNRAGGSFTLSNSNNFYSGQTIVLAGTLGNGTTGFGPTNGPFGTPSAANIPIVLGDLSGSNNATLSLSGYRNFWRTIWSRPGSTGYNMLNDSSGNASTLHMYAPITVDNTLIVTNGNSNGLDYYYFPFQSGGGTGTLIMSSGAAIEQYMTNTWWTHLGGTVLNNGTILQIMPAQNVATSATFMIGYATDGVSPGTITVDRATITFYTTINSGSGYLTCPNPLIVTTNGGSICGDSRSANFTNVYTGQIRFAGKVVLKNNANGSSAFNLYQGPFVIDQTTYGPHSLSISLVNATPKLQGTIADSANGNVNNSLVLNTNTTSPITNGCTHANGTFIEGDTVGIIDYFPPNNASLGTGNIWLADGAKLRLYNSTNVASGASIKMMSDGIGMSVLILSNNFVPTLTADSSGVLCADYSAFTAITNMASFGNGKMYLGAYNAGTFSGTALSPCSDGIYRIGGGGNAGIGTLTISGANVLTGATYSVYVGDPGFNPGDNGNVILSGTNSYGGGSTVNEYCQLEGTANATGTPFGSTNGVTLNTGILKLDGIATTVTNNIGALNIDSFGSLIMSQAGTLTNKLQIASVPARSATNLYVLAACGSSAANLGGKERIEIQNGLPSHTNGILPPYILIGDAALATYDFATNNTSSDALGVVGLKSASAAYQTVNSQATLTSCGANGIANVTAGFTTTADSSVYAMRIGSATIANDTVAHTWTIGSGGLIQASSSATLLGTMVNLAFGTSEALIAVEASVSVQANMTGSGGMTICGAGKQAPVGNPTFQITGTNLITGTLSIIGGVRMNYASDAQLGAVTNIYLDDGSLYYSGGSATITDTKPITLGVNGGLIQAGGYTRILVFNGNITGSGGLSANNVNLTLGGTNNTYSGGTYNQTALAGAVVTVQSNSTCGVGDVLLNGWGVFLGNHNIGGGDFYGSNTTNANARLSILDNGAAYFQTMAPSIGSLSGSGYVYLTNNCVLTLGADNTSTVYAGIIQPQSGTGAAITKTGTGTFTFKGMNGCSGVTTVNGGTFGADGYQAGGVTVNSSGTVTGSGSIGALTVSSGGNVQPGTTTTAKTLTVGGTATIASGGTFVANLNGKATNDQILATGAITITGATLTPNLNYTSTVGDVWTILSSVGGVTGTFNGLPDGTQISLAGGKFGRINYTAGTVTITAVSSSSAVDTSYLYLWLMQTP